jgi:hypothetical protein
MSRCRCSSQDLQRDVNGVGEELAHLFVSRVPRALGNDASGGGRQSGTPLTFVKRSLSTLGSMCSKGLSLLYNCRVACSCRTARSTSAVGLVEILVLVGAGARDSAQLVRRANHDVDPPRHTAERDRGRGAVGKSLKLHVSRFSVAWEFLAFSDYCFVC